MLKWDQHCQSLFAVKTTMRCVNWRKFRDPHDPYTELCPHCYVTQDVQHIILACDHPAVKAKRENFLARYAKYVKSFVVDTSRNKLRELLNLDPSCAAGCKEPAQKLICAFVDQVYRANGFAVFQSCDTYDDRKLVLRSALESMGAKLCFRYRSVNIGPSYK